MTMFSPRELNSLPTTTIKNGVTKPRVDNTAALHIDRAYTNLLTVMGVGESSNTSRGEDVYFNMRKSSGGASNTSGSGATGGQTGYRDNNLRLF